MRSMKSIHARLAKLEQVVRTDTITLTMPDGSIEVIRIHSTGRGDGIMDLVRQAIREHNAGQGYSREIDLFRRAVDASQSDGGHAVDLIRALLNGPVFGPEAARRPQASEALSQPENAR